MADNNTNDDTAAVVVTTTTTTSSSNKNNNNNSNHGDDVVSVVAVGTSTSTSTTTTTTETTSGSSSSVRQQQQQEDSVVGDHNNNNNNNNNETSSTTTPTTANTTTTTTTTQQPSVDIAQRKLQSIIQNNPFDVQLNRNELDLLRILLKDYDSSKEKVSKLKVLLGRSAKAQRETKIELDIITKRYEQSLKDIERLNNKIDKLANRPTHMELLADFETNFDRALLSVQRHNSSSHSTMEPYDPQQQQQQQLHQSGGQNTGAPSSTSIQQQQQQHFHNQQQQQQVDSAQQQEDQQQQNSSFMNFFGISNDNDHDRNDAAVSNSRSMMAGHSSSSGLGLGGGGGMGGVGGNNNNHGQMDQLLMQELNDAKQRIEKLETVNRSVMNQSKQLEIEIKDKKRYENELQNRISHLELEKRMAIMEADHAMRNMNEKQASLTEMQLEIDLITKSSMSANIRAAKGDELMKTVQTDKQYVAKLEQQVDALQEWARASSEAKAIAQDRSRSLEHQLRVIQNGGVDPLLLESHSERSERSEDGQVICIQRTLFVKHGSLVIGAGDQRHRIVTLTTEDIDTLKKQHNNTSINSVMLQWQFDVTPDDLTVDYSVYKGTCNTPTDFKNAQQQQQQQQNNNNNSNNGIGGTFISNRIVKGGAAGEIKSAFMIQNSCTLLWSNINSWIKPRTIKYVVKAVVITT